MRDLKARDVDVPVAARLVRPDQHVGAIAQLHFEIGERIARIAGDRPLPELLRDQAFEQRRLGPAEIAGLREAPRSQGDAARDRVTWPARTSSAASQPDRRCARRKYISACGACRAARTSSARDHRRTVAVPLDADHRQDDDAAAVIARLDQSGSRRSTAPPGMRSQSPCPPPPADTARRIGSLVD